MAHQQSYPSPTAVQTRAGAGPFYSNGGGSSHEDKDATNGDVEQLQLSGEIEHINPDLEGTGHHPHPDDYAAAQAHDHQALAQSVMTLQAHHQQPSYHIPVTSSHQSNALSAAAAAAAAAAAKQRSKVSRACDECRRKKVCIPMKLLHLHCEIVANSDRSGVMRPQKMILPPVQPAKSLIRPVSSRALHRNVVHQKGQSHFSCHSVVATSSLDF
jgi:hypothetical protein